MDDVENIKSPSNVIKFKYDLLKSINLIWCMNAKKGPEQDKAITEKGSIFEGLVKKERTERITHLEGSMMASRKLSANETIPSP